MASSLNAYAIPRGGGLDLAILDARNTIMIVEKIATSVLLLTYSGDTESSSDGRE